MAQGYAQILAGLGRGLGGPAPGMTPDAELLAAAQQQVGAVYGPMEQALRDSFARQLASGTAAIQGYASEAAAQMRRIAPAVAADYRQAQGFQQALDVSVAERLTGQGTGTARYLQDALALSGRSLPVDLAGMARASGGTTYALGSASLSQLLAHGAAASSYAQELPGIAQLHGLQSQRMLAAQSQRAMADQLGGMYTQRAGAVQDAYGGMRSSELEAFADWQERQDEIRQMIAKFALDGLKQLQSSRQHQADQDQDWQELQYTQGEQTYRTQLSQQGQDARQAARLEAAAADDKRGARESAVKSVRSTLASMEKEASSETARIAKGRKIQVPKLNPVDGKPMRDGSTTTETRPYAYGEAYRRLYEHLKATYAQKIKSGAIKDKRIRQMVAQALADAGITPPSSRRAPGPG